MGIDFRDCGPRIIRDVSMIVLTISILVVVSPTEVLSLPNIRIQVNSENLQNPPYLLDALKQVEKAEQKTAAAATEVEPVTAAASNLNTPEEPFANGQDATAQEAQQTNINTGTSVDEQLAASSGNDNKPLQSQQQSNLDENLAPIAETAEGAAASPVKEETYGSVLDVDPESMPKLSSSESSIGGSIASAAPMQSSAVVYEPPMTQEGSRDDKDDFKLANNNRHFQLDVTGSHLKRPSMASSGLIEEETVSDESSQQATMVRRQNQQVVPDGPGAKSRVSPSVVSEEAALQQPSSSSVPAPKLEEKIAASPPDTWEPNQVMHGVTNASLVPATVKRHYGHQTRTRITLGGGYQREQQPPLVNPSSSEYVDNKPETPKAPLMRPPPREQQAVGSAVDNSRVIEVPERIVLPASVFDKKQEQPAKNATIATLPPVASKRDARCPSNGITTLEHPNACDKYFLCENGFSSVMVCPNGLMYGTRDIVRDHCVHRWQAVCGDKSIPNPISSPGCRWQNGIFNVQGSPKCTPDFYECTDGVFEVKKCTNSGQVYDDKTKSCQYAEQVGCAQEALAEFQCPTDDQSNTYWPFPRYFLNERALIHCVSDKPQIIRCRDHERVDPEHLFCVPIDKSAPPVNEDGSPAEAVVSARRATTTQREKGKAQKTENR